MLWAELTRRLKKLRLFGHQLGMKGTCLFRAWHFIYVTVSMCTGDICC